MLRRLIHKPSVRQAEKAFVAEGFRVVQSALLAGAPVDAVYVTVEARGNEALEALVDLALHRGARVFDLASGVMEKVADTVTPQPICAVVNALDLPLASLTPKTGDASGSLAIVCVDVRDPGNFGAVLRSASASGAAGIVACAGCVDPYNPKAVRASAGAIFAMPLVRAGDPGETLSLLSDLGYATWGTAVDGGVDYLEAPLGGNVALVLGNEANGLPPELSAMLDGYLTIPMSPGNESLNVAMTATALCFEAARQRRAR